jgi:hypothetical protein
MRTPQLGLQKVTCPDGEVFWTDTRYFPIASIRVLGKLSMSVAKTFEEWLIPMVELARSKGTKIIVVNDISRVPVPPPDVRKVMAESANKVQGNPGFGYWIPVVPNPLLRGVLTAVLWMVNDEEKRTFYVTSVQHGFSKAIELYTGLGLALPDVNPDTYSFPEPK